jgi:hypothetical protein
VPKSIAIMGSGAVGVEFASIFKSYGSEVTIIELLPRLVPGEDEAVSAELEKTFKRRGIKRSPARRSPRQGGRQGRRRGDGRRADGKAQKRLVRVSCSWPPGAARSPRASDADKARPQDGSRLHRRRRAVPHQRARASRPSAT